MKKIISIFAFAAVAAATLVSCSKEIDNPEVINNGVKMKTITVKTAIETKTTLDAAHENIVWSAGDKISIFNDANNTNLEADYAEGADITIEVPEATTEIYAHYPYYSGNSDGPESVSVYISNNQTQTNPGQLNGYFFPMVAKGTVSADNKALISLYPVAGALALNLYHTDLSGEESVKSVKITPASANTNFTGRQTTDITGDNIVYSQASISDPVTVTLTNALALGNTKPTDKQTFAGQIYVCLAKQSYSGVTFEIETDKGTYTITSNNTAFDLENNDFVPVNINLAKAQFEAPYSFVAQDFELASSIAVGDKIIITNGTSGNVAVMKHYEGSNNNYKKVDAAVSSTITSTEDMAVLTVSGEAGNLTLYDPATKLYVNATNTTSKNYLRSSDAVDDYAKWNITFSGSAAVITNTGKESHNIIRYNSAVDQLIFSAYDSGKQQPVYVFKQAAPRVLDHITLSGTYPTEFFVGDAFDYTGLVVTAHYTNGMSATVNPTSVSTPDMSAEDVVTVTVSYTENEITKTATYDIIITERGAYTVILGDDATELTESAAGAGVVLPTRSAIGDYAFYGWSETEVTTESSTAPTLVTVTDGKYYPTEDIILYPVYKKGSGTTTWVKTALSDITAGEYILVTNDGTKVFNGTMTKGHGQVSSSAISFVGESATTIPSDACIMTLASVTDGFTMYNANKGYLYASKAASGGLAWHESEDSHWSYTSGNWRYSKEYSGNYAYLRSYDNSSFRTYSTNNGAFPILAKKTTVNTETYISVPTE